MIYLDSAILVKLYTEEPDSEHWRSLVDGQADLATSNLALTEVRYALRQKVVHGFVKRSQEAPIWREFHRAMQSGDIQIFPLGEDVVNDSVLLLEQMPRSVMLRSLDALHLATVRLSQCSALATTDKRMRMGANILNIALI